MRTPVAIIVCCVVFLLGCWVARPSRYQLVQSDSGAPLRLDTRTGEVVLLQWDRETGTFKPLPGGARAAQDSAK